MAKIIVKTSDLRKVKVLLSDLTSRQIRISTSRAIRRTITTVRKTASQEFRSAKLVNMRSAKLKQKIRQFDHSGANKPVTEQYGEVSIDGHELSMAYFFARRVAAGRSRLTGKTLYSVTLNAEGMAALNAQGKARLAFMAPKGSAFNKVIFARSGAKRTPIEKLYGPSLGELAQSHGMVSRLVSVASDRYEANFAHELDFAIQRAVERARQAK